MALLPLLLLLVVCSQHQTYSLVSPCPYHCYRRYIHRSTSSNSNSNSNSRRSSRLCYQILGGLEEEEDVEQADQDDQDTQGAHYSVNLRHLPFPLQLKTQSHEPDGSVSMAGTPWEASLVLADYITSPASSSSSSPSATSSNGIVDWQDKTVLELGSGIGLCAIAAALMGAQVTATDAVVTSLKLIRENSAIYEQPQKFRYGMAVLPLLWGDTEAMNALPQFDIIMASDVIFFRSSRVTLKTTIEALCGPTTLVVLAHTWRTHPLEDQAFLDSFPGDFERQEVDASFMPPGYQSRGSDGRLPVSIFLFRRKKNE